MLDTRAVMRSLPLVASVLGRKYGVTVAIGGTEAYTDGSAIHLPALPVSAPDTFLALARGYIDHEAAHLRDTDFAVLKAANLTPLEHHVWNIIEDWRVENRLVASFPGCRGNFDWLIEHFFGGKVAGTRIDPAALFLNWLLLTVRAWDVPVIGKQRDSIAAHLDKLCPGLLTRMACVVEAVRTSCASTAEAIAHARAIVAELGKATETPQPASGTNQDASQAGGAPDGTGNGNQPTASPWERIRNLLHAQEDELPQEFGVILGEALKREAPASDGLPVNVATVTHKVSWDLHPDDIAEAKRASTALRTRLHGLLQAATISRTHGARSGRLDPRRLHRIATDDARIFMRKGTRVGINTAVHLLLDCSGSMTPNIRLASTACHAVASALETVSINVAITAFPASHDPASTEQKTVGRLVRHGQRVHPRLKVAAVGTTPLAESLWWVMQEMLPLREARKLILLLTDGDPDTPTCALEAIRHAERLRFEVYAIGIGAVNILQHLPGRHRTINTLAELAPAMFGLLQGALVGRRAT
ncbi:cobaltochelatase CobT-related protein [Nitratidesulfovibrio sp. 1201_IL3209]|uniref:cobaltochelatase CobT-related protein n=1 Tax=Nitratidesulfovibrio sp. 1201_IL3209 TaxID=3084053 RepID=UPI002FD90CD1